MRCDGQIKSLGEVRDFHEDGDTAAIGYVRLREADATRRNEGLELVKRAQVLARGDRYAAMRDHARMTGDVVRNDRLLEPHEAIRLEGARPANGFIGRPGHVRVRHEREVVAEIAAQSLDALDILRHARAARLHLDSPEAFGEIGVMLLDEIVDGEMKVDAASIAGHGGIMTAEQAPERQVRPARLEIPQRHVEGGLREHARPAAPAIVQTPPHFLPEPLDAVGVVATNDFGNVAGEQPGDGAAIMAGGVGVSDALCAVGIAHAGGDQLEGGHGAVRGVRQRYRQWYAVESGLDLLDGCHGVPLP